jgi:bacteriocin biosynthesis cyclodehydratase domain-containing protein
MRPALKPGLATVWRNRDTVQIGIDPRRAVALTGMRGAGNLLRLLDGSRDRHQVLAAAGDLGMDAAAADRVLTLLAAAGALDDFPAGGQQPAAGARARLAPELATASLAHRDADGGARTLARRQGACVRVHGASRAGLSIAGMLSAAGVGLVVSTGPTVPRPAPVRAAAPPPPRRHAAAPAPRSRPRRRPDLVVLADTHRRELPAALARHRVPHLAAAASEAIGVVGPLVLPGRSACLRCLDLTRAERDPAWPVILAQLASRPGAEPLACDTVLATMVAAQAAAQALAFIDQGAEATAVTGATLELVLPGWQWRRRTWPPHPNCGCQHRD